MYDRLDVLEREIKSYNDVILLDIKENMNDGKTWEMFKWIHSNMKARFVMKSDEDSFVNIPALLARLDHFQKVYPTNYRV